MTTILDYASPAVTAIALRLRPRLCHADALIAQSRNGTLLCEKYHCVMQIV
jgi:hypothetical protein